MKYKVGDKVIIRSWDDMKKQFGVDAAGDIKSKCCFVTYMRKYCGKEMTISRITRDGNYEMMNGGGWKFSEDTFEKKHSQKIVITTDGTETLARLYEGGKVVKSATAKCSPKDAFDFNIGARLAFDRLLGEEKKELKWRVVNRPAKVGDYVRIIREIFSFNEIGDILKVAKIHNGTGIIVKACDHPRDTDAHDNYEWCYLAEHYEVIEPCTAEKKEEYYNGKVVCVRRGWNKSIPLPDITIGKIYTVVDGFLTFDNGTTSFRYKSLNDLCRGMGHEFIPLVEETKGE